MRGLGEMGFSLLLFLLRPVELGRLCRMSVRFSDVSKVSEIDREVSLVGSAVGGMDEEDEMSLGVLLRLVVRSTNDTLAGESTSFSSPSSADTSGGSAKRAKSSGG